MGNFFPVRLLNSTSSCSCIRLSIRKNRKVLRVVQMDGKVVEFTSPVLVGDLLNSFEGLVVKSSEEAPHDLPPSSELKLGETYYLSPSNEAEKQAAASLSVRAEAEEADQPRAAVKRIKVVITKKQLQELLAKKISPERIILGIDKSSPVNIQTSWKPCLSSIPEDQDDFNIM